jgi:predicted dehydrogenase
MRSAAPLGVALIGAGFIGRTHARAFSQTPGARVLAIADPHPDALRTLRESVPALGDVQHHTTPDPLWKDPAIDAVVICTPTETHVELALQALHAGKHVLLEKPIALRADEVSRLRNEAARHPRLCMPAMCMRHWPGWTWLREQIVARSLGPLRSLSMTRMGALPAWARDFYADTSRSGGVLFDLHIHDADFVHWCLGAPRSVMCAGDDRHLTTLFRFASDAGLHVRAEASWRLEPAAGFRMHYLACFDDATVEWALSSTGTTHRLHQHGATRDLTIEMPVEADGYAPQAAHFVACARGGAVPRATLDDALAVTRTLEAVRTARDTACVVGIGASVP